MTTSHLTLVPTAHLARNDFGQTVLQDVDTNNAWWAMHPEADTHEAQLVRVGSVDYDATLADAMLGEAREPDMCDDGRAYWLTDTAVVSIDVERIAEITGVLTMPRIRIVDDMLGAGWARIAPSHYGVEVLSFHEHNGEPSEHDAHTAWEHVAKAVRA